MAFAGVFVVCIHEKFFRFFLDFFFFNDKFRELKRKLILKKIRVQKMKMKEILKQILLLLLIKIHSDWLEIILLISMKKQLRFIFIKRKFNLLDSV